MTKALALQGTYGYQTPKAGTVVFDGLTQAPEAIGLTSHGFAAGPVEISPYTSSTAVVTDLTYGASSGGFFDGWGSDDGSSDDGGSGDFFAGALAAGAAANSAEDDDDDAHTTTRRDFIKAGGLALLGGSAAAKASAQSQTVTVATFDLTFPAGAKFRLRDLGPGYLPTDGLYYVLINGMDYAETQGGTDGSATLPPDPAGKTRSVKIATDAGSIIAGAKETIGQKALDYQFTLSQSPAKASTGTQLTLSDHPLLVAATLRSGPSATTLSVGGEAIPHRTEARDKPEGYYFVESGTLVYQVGAGGPASTAAEFTIYAGNLGEQSNDIQQQY